MRARTTVIMFPVAAPDNNLELTSTKSDICSGQVDFFDPSGALRLTQSLTFSIHPNCHHRDNNR